MVDDGEFGGTGDGPVTEPAVVHEAQADEAIVSRISLVEDQPLADRAPAFAQLVDELRAHLEGTDGEARRSGA
ncbi:hypothetical protein OVN20_11355 [Microcella daejeonensis]|uniref:hypothetical protein n=1 Tax=Microcella daejeonensis TaxID=2994971 RepID=UPI002271AA3B|nr:hypothetical protein [Microcella daejeonensis]WAB83636.1 hypothetical protein OVN20_11355 [Microcella daejeonensis]